MVEHTACSVLDYYSTPLCIKSVVRESVEDVVGSVTTHHDFLFECSFAAKLTKDDEFCFAVEIEF